MSLLATVICFIACHGGPADHFATFAESLSERGYEVHIYAAGPALQKFQDRKIDVWYSFNADTLAPDQEKELAEQIAGTCGTASVVITDVGHPFDIALQNALKKRAPQVLNIAYYDNPEPYVPGGYSDTAAKVMAPAKRVLFPNTHLANTPLYQAPGQEIELPFAKRVGIGYYPMAQAEKIAEKRAQEQSGLRKELFAKWRLKEQGQKVLVYFGGNNTEYFEKAFPAFLHFLSEGKEAQDLSNWVIVLQQHPGAKAQGIDRKQLEAWLGKGKRMPKIVISEETSDKMQIMADGALYYQTSMGPLFALSGIPTVQVAHETYPDLLVRAGLTPSVTNAADFVDAVMVINPVPLSEEKKGKIMESLGIKKDWIERLERAIEK